jgi:hypothetical protein
MALGLFASMGAILRTVQLREFYSSKDTFRMNVTISLWATVEQQVGLIAATIPTLKAFFEKTLVRIGLFFYEKESETQVRVRLVSMGFLDAGEEDERVKGSDGEVIGVSSMSARTTMTMAVDEERTEKDVEKELMKLV